MTIQEEIQKIGFLFGLKPRFRKDGRLYKSSYKVLKNNVDWYDISNFLENS